MSDQNARFCVFCGIPFTVDSVNDVCLNNKSYKMNTVNTDKDWSTVVPDDVRGSKRHFWYECQPSHRKKPNLEGHSLVRKGEKKHFWNCLSELETVKHVLKRH